jgi:Tol biopolymer transport system component
VFPGQNGRIVYGAGAGLSYGVHTILPSGQGDQVIGHSGSFFSWSPNGRRIASASGYGDIYTMRADGSDVRQLTFDGGSYSPSYSPDGGRIAFGHNGAVTVMRSDGSDRHVIGGQGGAEWAPNGKLVFTKGRVGNTPPSLWEMNPDGSHQHRLVFLGGDGGYGGIFSPNGSKFLFVRYQNDGTTDILVADAGGSNVRKPPCSPNAPLSYSPDGRWILGNGPTNSAGRTNLLRVSSHPPCARKKVVSPVNPGSADWQPLP